VRGNGSIIEKAISDHRNNSNVRGKSSLYGGIWVSFGQGVGNGGHKEITALLRLSSPNAKNYENFRGWGKKGRKLGSDEGKK